MPSRCLARTPICPPSPFKARSRASQSYCGVRIRKRVKYLVFNTFCKTWGRVPEMTRKIVLAPGILLSMWITTFTLGAARSEVADAAMRGDKAALRRLIEQKADLNEPQADG